MFLVNSIKTFGNYLILMGRVMSRPQRWRIFFRQGSAQEADDARDIPAWRGLHPNCPADIIFHRSGNMHSDET